MNKYAVFAIIVVTAVVLDLWTKNIAENNLASVTSRWAHPIEREVGDVPDDFTVADWVDAEFGDGTSETSPPRVQGIYRRAEDGSWLGPLGMSRPVYDDDVLRVNYRSVEIVPGFWNHVYVQNFGAAWGFLSNKDESFVRPFFLTVSILAVIIVLGIFRNVRPDQKVLIVALSLIVGGAIGNFVDRARYGYVVDFIDWYLKWGGEEHHWPTFNVADVWITIGVGLMVIEIMTTKDDDEAEGDAVPVGDADPIAA